MTDYPYDMVWASRLIGNKPKEMEKCILCGKDVDLCPCDDQDDEPETYRVSRIYFNDDVPTQTIATGLTLAEAQEHCHNLETSSSTCTTPEGIERTKKHGPWFDSYTAE